MTRPVLPPGRIRALVVIILTMAGLLAGASAASAATVTPPDMKILVPTDLISIGLDGVTGNKMLRYTHITQDAGVGPFEIDPSYNAATGISSFVQSIYSSSSPGVWSFDHTVPLAVNGAFVNGSDYRFPLTRFSLNNVNPDGSTGTTVVVSPKTDYCITGDNRVGDVPNTPSQTSPPAGNCSDPTKPLGWSVGWGDQYDQTDSGQPIDLTGVADGTYVLRATVDAQHVLTESDVTNNVTDTQLTIAGTTVTVGAQTHPVVAPPSVGIASPSDGASVTGTVNLAVNATAAAPASVSSVQYLLDGNALGAPQTVAPYGYAWTVGSTPVGSHRLSAQVADSAGNISTAPVETVTVPPSSLPPGFVVDQTINETGHGAIITPAFSTAAAGETILAFVGSDGPSGTQTATVSGAGLSWSLVKRSNASGTGDSEIWKATAATSLSGATVTSTLVSAGYDQQLTVVSFAGSAGIGAIAGASGSSGAPAVAVTATAPGSLVYAVGNDFDAATGRTVGAAQALVSQWTDTATGDTFWTQAATSGSTGPGQVIAMSDPQPTGHHWNLSAVEVVPSGNNPPPPPDTTPPTVSLTNPANGQTVSGITPVAANASDNVAVASVSFLLDGQPLGAAQTTAPYSVSWDTTVASAGSHSLSAVAKDTSGNSTTATAVTVTVSNPARPMTCFVLQAQKTIHGRGNVTTPGLTTAMAGETLVAFVTSDGPKTASSQTATVTGAGLTWKLAKRANAQYGDTEIWTATAPAILSNVTVKSTLAKVSYDQALTVIAMEGVAGVGAKAGSSAVSGAPSVGLTTTAAASLVFAAGNDWDGAVARSLPTGQVVLDQWVDSASGDTMWSQYANAAVSPLGSAITMTDTAPTADRWNMVAIELQGEAG